MHMTVVFWWIIIEVWEEYIIIIVGLVRIAASIWTKLQCKPRTNASDTSPHPHVHYSNFSYVSSNDGLAKTHLETIIVAYISCWLMWCGKLSWFELSGNLREDLKAQPASHRRLTKPNLISNSVISSCMSSFVNLFIHLLKRSWNPFLSHNQTTSHHSTSFYSDVVVVVVVTTTLLLYFAVLLCFCCQCTLRIIRIIEWEIELDGWMWIWFENLVNKAEVVLAL